MQMMFSRENLYDIDVIFQKTVDSGPITAYFFALSLAND